MYNSKILTPTCFFVRPRILAPFNESTVERRNATLLLALAVRPIADDGLGVRGCELADEWKVYVMKSAMVR